MSFNSRWYDAPSGTLLDLRCDGLHFKEKRLLLSVAFSLRCILFPDSLLYQFDLVVDKL